jgi:cytochrome d ubiquinol oxidase subunit II
MEMFVVLKVLWAVLLGVLLSGLAIMVGMDMGVGTLLRFIGGVWVAHMNGYTFTSAVDPNMPPTPLNGPSVGVQAGAWMHNYAAYPLIWALPALGFVGMLGGSAMVYLRKPIIAWWLGAVAWIGMIFTTGATMFPFLMPSATTPAESLTVWNASGSEYNLGWMLFFALVFTPIILAYTSWCFYVMRGKVKVAAVEHNDHSY